MNPVQKMNLMIFLTNKSKKQIRNGMTYLKII